MPGAPRGNEIRSITAASPNGAERGSFRGTRRGGLRLGCCCVRAAAAQVLRVLPLAVVHTLGNLLTNVSLGAVAVSFTHTIKVRWRPCC